jgi:hypothetical protein
VKTNEPRTPAGKETKISCPLFYWNEKSQNEKEVKNGRNMKVENAEGKITGETPI